MISLATSKVASQH